MVNRLDTKLGRLDQLLTVLKIEELLHHFYQVQLAHAILAQDTLIITIGIPLLPMQKEWYLYSVVNFGESVAFTSRHGKDTHLLRRGVTHMSSMQVPQVLAMIRGNTLFHELMNAEANACLHTHQGLCTQIKTYKTCCTFSCITVICLDNTTKI